MEQARSDSSLKTSQGEFSSGDVDSALVKHNGLPSDSLEKDLANEEKADDDSSSHEHTIADEPESLRNSQPDILDILNTAALSLPFDDSKEAEDPDASALLDESVVKAKLSTIERVMKDVPCPPKKRLRIEDLFDEETGLSRHELLKDHLRREGLLAEDAALRIINEGAQILRRESNVVKVDAPVTVCGDVHGQFYDLLTLFEVGGKPGETNYLFLGDYVDRGSFGIEIVLYLWSLKVNYPDSFFLLRGNHETRHLTSYFTFKQECLTKYTAQVYNACMGAFDSLPLAAVVNKQFFCVHGGLSPKISTVDDIEEIERFREPPQFGPMIDLLWSDPRVDYGSETDDHRFSYNSVRGASYYYSYDAVCEFLNRNDLLCVIRAHEALQNGYKLYRSYDDFPSLLTLFSAPNYPGYDENKAGILKYDTNLFSIRQFDSVPQPYWLPNFADAFSWSASYLAEKVTGAVLAFMNVCNDEELEAESPPRKSIRRGEIIRHKVKAVGIMARGLTTLRVEEETVSQLKNLSPNGFLPRGALSNGKKSLENALTTLQGEYSAFLKHLNGESRRITPREDESPPAEGRETSSAKRRTRTHSLSPLPRLDFPKTTQRTRSSSATNSPNFNINEGELSVVLPNFASKTKYNVSDK